MWTQTRYACLGETVSGQPCQNTLPFPYRYCWTHRHQNPNWGLADRRKRG